MSHAKLFWHELDYVVSEKNESRLGELDKKGGSPSAWRMNGSYIILTYSDPILLLHHLK